MQESVFIASNGVEILYKCKPKKYDFRHLIVVFSGFLNANPGNYDFINAMADCPCDVIWINDKFENMYAYYLCVQMDFKVKEAIEEFVRVQAGLRNISLDNITFTGYSKGGSAALYHGLSMNIKNIVISVPQIKIGSYIHKNWASVAKHMMQDGYCDAQIDYLDKLIVNLLKKDVYLNRNIYLLTSEYDEQYLGEIKPYLTDFQKYENFNLLKTYSVFVREHNQVTSHHTALLLGIYYSLASEATPRFNSGEVNFFGSQPIPKMDVANATPYVDLRKFHYKNDILFVDGVAILRGVHIADYSDISYELLLRNVGDGKEYVKNLAKTHRPHLTRELFDGDFVVYDKGWFTTYQYKGVRLSDLPKGEYYLFIKITIKSQSQLVALSSNQSITVSGEGFNFESNKSLSKLTLS